MPNYLLIKLFFELPLWKKNEEYEVNPECVVSSRGWDSLFFNKGIRNSQHMHSHRRNAQLAKQQPIIRLLMMTAVHQGLIDLTQPPLFMVIHQHVLLHRPHLPFCVLYVKKPQSFLVNEC